MCSTEKKDEQKDIIEGHELRISCDDRTTFAHNGATRGCNSFPSNQAPAGGWSRENKQNECNERWVEGWSHPVFGLTSDGKVVRKKPETRRVCSEGPWWCYWDWCRSCSNRPFQANIDWNNAQVANGVPFALFFSCMDIMVPAIKASFSLFNIKSL